MRITLKSLSMRNFKGIRSLKLTFNDDVTEIHGDNATGKTTIVDAFSWLLFGKDSNGKADFQIKTLVDGKIEHGLEHSVEAVIEIDGRNVTLTRTMTEKWVKQRGSSVPDMKGHETMYAVDGVPHNQTEFQKWLDERIDAEKFGIVTSVTAFNSLHWKKRRDILMDVVGDILDADVIASNPELAELSGLERKLEDEKKVLTADRKKANDEIEQIPAKITALSDSIAEYRDYSILNLTAESEALSQRIEAARATGGTSELIAKKSELSHETDTLMYEYERNCTKAKDTARTASDNARKAVNDTISKKNEITRRLVSVEQDIAGKQAKLDDLRAERQKLKEPVTVDTDCPACGQTLPEDKINATKAEVQRKLNASLETNAEAGKALKAEIDKLASEAEAIKTEVAELDDEIAKLVSEAEEAKAALDNVVLPNKPTRLEEIKAEMTELDRQISENRSADTSEMETELKIVNEKITNAKHRDKVLMQIDGLRNREKELSVMLEKADKTLFLIDRFVVTKVSLLEKKINEKFKFARFKLFEQQINGGINEVCVTLFDGVPYGYGLNRGAEINVGLDIVDTLSNHYDLQAPVFVDNSESVTRLINIDTQLIKLIVDANAKTLEVA